MDVVVEEAAYGVVVVLNGVVDIDTEVLATLAQLAKLPAAAVSGSSDGGAANDKCMTRNHVHESGLHNMRIRFKVIDQMLTIRHELVRRR